MQEIKGEGTYEGSEVGKLVLVVVSGGCEDVPPSPEEVLAAPLSRFPCNIRMSTSLNLEVKQTNDYR